MKKVYFFEFWNCTPHLETAFELAKQHVDAGDEVHFHFGGHDTLFQEGLSISLRHKLVRYGLMALPECRGAQLLAAPNFHFYPRMAMQAVQWRAPQTTWSVAALREYRHGEYEAGLSALSSLITLTRTGAPDFVQWHDKTNEILASGIQVYETVRTLLAEQKPDLVYVFNGRFSSYRAVLDAARAEGVPFLVHERGADKTRYYLQPYMPHYIEKRQQEMLALWQQEGSTPQAQAIARQFFADRRKGKDQGWHSFSRQQLAGLLPDIDSRCRLVTYFSSSDDEYVAVGDIYQWRYWPDQRRAVECLLQVCARHPEIQLVIRLHPHLALKSATDQQAWLAMARHQHVTVISPDSKIDTYALMDASDVVVSALSTTGIEAVHWGKPSINLGPSAYEVLDATYVPQNEAELEALLLDENLQADPGKTLAFGYYYSVFGNPFRYYEPETLFSGRFLGVNLQATPAWLAWPIRVWRWEASRFSNKSKNTQKKSTDRNNQ